MTLLVVGLVALLQAIPPAPQPAQEPVDPALQAAVERFYAMQEAEDVQGYVALWSASARRPEMPMQLKFIFDNGDDKFTDLQIQRAVIAGDQARVRVAVTRARTDHRVKRPDGLPAVFNTRLQTALTYVREGGEWKLLREGTPIDELAHALHDAKTEAERNALLDAEPDLHNQRLVDALSRPADALVVQGRYSDAIPLYAKVRAIARRISQPKAEAQALQNIANAYYLLRHFDRALKTYEEELALSRETANDTGIAAALVGIGTIRYSTYEYPAALDAYREALVIHERIDDGIEIGRTVVHIGNVEFIHGNFDEAIAHYRRSRDIFRKLAYKGGEAWALEGLGRVYNAQGNLAGALEAYTAVLDNGRINRDTRAQGTALHHLGQIHLRLGNLDAARTSFDEARKIYESTKDLANVGFAWQGIALTELVASRFAASEKAYVQSESFCTAAQEPECAAHAIVGLAFAQASQDHFDEAIATYHKGIAAFVKLEKSEETARAEIGLSQALLGKKDYEAAAKAAVRARDRGTALANLDVLWRALDAEARAVRQLGDRDKATALAREALANIEKLKDAAMERPGKPVPSDTTSAFALLALLQAAAGDVAGAFDSAERRRAHALRVHLANNEREIHRGMTDAEREEERAIVGELVSLHARRDHERTLPKKDPERVAKLDAAIREAAARRRAYQQRLFERLPDLALWRGFVDLRPRDQGAGGRGGGRTEPSGRGSVVEFIVDEDDVLILHAPATGGDGARRAHAVPIARQTLAERVARAIEPAALRDIVLWRKASLDVFNLLPAEVTTELSRSPRVTIVPDDVLWRIPFEAMPAGDKFLADHAAVSYTGSRFALADRGAAGSRAVPMLAVSAAPLAPAVRDRVKSTSPDWTIRTPEAADAEIKRVIPDYGETAAVVQAAAEATEAAFRTAAPGAALLHVAAPFRINGASPLFSSVLLAAGAPDAGGADDGALEAREVMNLTLGARIVMLSDGASASMRNAGAAGAIIQWAWLAGGVPAVVLPRWGSDESASGVLLSEFYARLKAGDAPEAALRSARAAVRKAEATSAPFHWAGWMLLGR